MRRDNGTVIVGRWCHDMFRLVRKDCELVFGVLWLAGGYTWLYGFGA